MRNLNLQYICSMAKQKTCSFPFQRPKFHRHKPKKWGRVGISLGWISIAKQRKINIPSIPFPRCHILSWLCLGCFALVLSFWGKECAMPNIGWAYLERDKGWCFQIKGLKYSSKRCILNCACVVSLKSIIHLPVLGHLRVQRFSNQVTPSKDGFSSLNFRHRSLKGSWTVLN